MKPLLYLFLVSSVLTVDSRPAVAQKSGGEMVPPALRKYVDRPEKVFAWKHKNKRRVGDGTIYDLELTSQKWQGITWKHVLHIYEPAKVRFKRHVLLYVTGGSNNRRPGVDQIALGLRLAEKAGGRVAMLYQVPNQPLLGGRREDDLITETWLRFLKTGDANWPLLFPMVKSAVKAMDAVEAFGRSQWNQPAMRFVVTGGSKRGWTSWLTAVVDERVAAIAPMVIDTLNFQPQMKHQLDTWGKYSEQIIDYTSKGLIKPRSEESPRDAQLRRMMDPYTYRKQLTLPKLLINATNDRYWVLDATNQYWDGLVGPKYLLQVPNAGHSLRGGRESALSTLAAFYQHMATSTPLPTLKWSHSRTTNGLRLLVKSSRVPKKASLWTARSDTKDFRKAKWSSQRMKSLKNGTFAGELPKPKTGHVALFGELQFSINGLTYALSTQIRRE